MFNLEANMVSVRLKPVIPSVTIGHNVLSGGHRERRLQPLIVTTWCCVSESKSNRSQVLTLPASQVSWDKATMGPSGIPEILGFLEPRTAVCERFRGLQPGILVEATWDFGVQKPGTTCRFSYRARRVSVTVRRTIGSSPVGGGADCWFKGVEVGTIGVASLHPLSRRVSSLAPPSRWP